MIGHREDTGFGALIALTMAPIINALQRGIIRLRIDHSAKAVEVLNRRIRNDRAAMRLCPDRREAIEAQIAEWTAAIADEHTRQCLLYSALVLLK